MALIGTHVHSTYHNAQRAGGPEAEDRNGHLINVLTAGIVGAAIAFGVLAMGVIL
jgi:hypothetical protein